MFHKSIIDKTNGRFEEIIKFADENQIKDKFINCLDRIEKIQNNSDNEYKHIEIYNDFAENSLIFSFIKNDGSNGLTGGIIFHKNNKTWNIHT
jgi:phosphopantetheine adenylyltransferase